ADERRDQLAPAGERAELQIVRDALRVGAEPRPLVERADRTPRQRTGRGVVEEDRLAGGGPREFGGAERVDIVGHGRAISGSPAPRGTPARCDRGSRASRSASPSRLKPSTAAPIANPGKTEVHGAWRS